MLAADALPLSLFTAPMHDVARVPRSLVPSRDAVAGIMEDWRRLARLDLKTIEWGTARDPDANHQQNRILYAMVRALDEFLGGADVDQLVAVTRRHHRLLGRELAELRASAHERVHELRAVLAFVLEDEHDEEIARRFELPVPAKVPTGPSASFDLG